MNFLALEWNNTPNRWQLDCAVSTKLTPNKSTILMLKPCTIENLLSMYHAASFLLVSVYASLAWWYTYAYASLGIRVETLRSL